jgi:hypothetical protein
MKYDEASKRNTLPVPANQYGGSPGGTYNYFDELSLNPPSGAKSATINLMYQPTSWEYVQFLYIANNKNNAFLQNEGTYLLEAWLNTGMAEPYVMASATWRSTEGGCNAHTPTLLSANAGNSEVILTWQDIPDTLMVIDGYKLYYDQGGKAQLVADIDGQTSNTHTDTDLTNGQEYCYKVTSYYTDGIGTYCESAFSNILCATPTNPGQIIYAGVDMVKTGKWITQGKGKDATTTFNSTKSFTAGDAIVIQAHVVSEDSVALPNAIVTITIKDHNGVTLATLDTGPSNANGEAEVTWQTQKPNKRGQGGTPSGVYSAETTNLSVSGYEWNGVKTNTTFCIDDASCSQ